MLSGKYPSNSFNLNSPLNYFYNNGKFQIVQNYFRIIFSLPFILRDTYVYVENL